jgi:hypothetical protein
MPTDQWPRFAAAALQHISGGKLERYGVDACVIDVLLLANRVDAEWEKRKAEDAEKAIDSRCRPGEVRFMGKTLDVYLTEVRRAERERVLALACGILWQEGPTGASVVLKQAWRDGRFDLPKEGK